MAPQAARRFHQAGVGSRTGLRLSAVARDDDGFENLDDFYTASKRAMDARDQHPSPSSDEEDQEEQDDADEHEDEHEDEDEDEEQIRISFAPRASSSVIRSSTSTSTSPKKRTPIKPRVADSFIDDDYPSRSFDLSAMAGDDTVAMESDDDTTLGGGAAAAAPRAPSAGLAARQANSRYTKPSAYRDSDSDSGLEDAYTSRKGKARARESVEFQLPQDSMPLAADNSSPPPQMYDDYSPPPDEDQPSLSLAPSFSLSLSRSSSSPKKKAKPPAKPKSAETGQRTRPRPRGRGRPPKKKQHVDESDAVPSDQEDDDDDDDGGYLETTKKSQKNKTTTRAKRGKAVAQSGSGREVVEKVPSRDMRTGSVDVDGIRRGTRHRYAPLEWWRGERVRYGRPSLPQGLTAADLHLQSGGAGEDEFEDHPAYAIRSVPVPVVKEVIRIPRAPGEGTFAGTTRRRGKRARQRKTEDDEEDQEEEDEEEYDEQVSLDPTADTVHPEDGWDRETAALGIVLNPETGEEEEKRIACTASSVRPRRAFNQSFSFEKVFSIDSTMAAGMLQIPPGGSKPTKSSKDNNYVFVVLQGALRIKIHRRTFTIAPGGTFLVPAGNNYSLENVCQREAKLFFAQSRKGSPEELANMSLSIMSQSQSQSQSHAQIYAKPRTPQRSQAGARLEPEPEPEESEDGFQGSFSFGR